MRYTRLQKISIAALAVIGGIGIVVVIGGRLMRSRLNESGGVGALSGGISLSLFTILIVLIVAIVLSLLLFGRGSGLR